MVELFQNLTFDDLAKINPQTPFSKNLYKPIEQSKERCCRVEFEDKALLLDYKVPLKEQIRPNLVPEFKTHYETEDDTLEIAKQFIKNKEGLLITGGPGNGKSYMSRLLCEYAETLGIQVHKMSRTHVCARNIDGITTNRWLHCHRNAVSYTHLTLPTKARCRSRWSPYH